MKTFIVCLLACLPALLLARPNQFDAKAAIAKYALTHPNTLFDEPECEVLGQSEDEEVSPLNAIADKKRVWKNNILYYEMSEPTYTPEEIDALKAGLTDIQTNTSVNGKKCITFEESSSAENRVVIRNCGGTRCSSYVGMRGGEQRMCLAERCFRRHGTIMHEFLHALGFHHEHKRADRDEYVFINFDNIRSGKEGNFHKLVEGVSVDHLGTNYDYGSIMHYSAYGFAVDRSIPTILPLDQSAKIGQRLALSALDIERVQILYGCKKAADSVYFKHLAHLY